MSKADATAFLDRVEHDADFRSDLESAGRDPAALLAKVRAAGFDAEPDEIRDALGERYGGELSDEQLAQIAGAMPSPPEDNAGYRYLSANPTLRAQAAAAAGALGPG